MTSPKTKKRLSIAPLALLLLLSAVVSVSAMAAELPSSVFQLPFALKDDQNQEVRFSDWSKQPLVVTMSYTNCKKTCPNLTLKKLQEIQSRFESKKVDAQFAIVTFDAENDTPKRLAQYRKDHGFSNPNWHFLTGTSAQIRQVAKKLNLADFFEMDEHIVHGFKIFIFTPDGHISQLDWEHRDVAAAIP